MATQLSESDLPQLLSWLHNNLPTSFKLYQELRNHLRGKFPHLDFYVDRWPDPQAAAAVIDPLKGGDFYKDRVLGMFAVTDEAAAILLKDERVVDWRKSVFFSGVTDQCRPVMTVIRRLATEMGTALHINPSCLMTVGKEDLQHVPVPDGMKTSALSEQDVGTVNSTWKYCTERTLVYIRDQVQYFPSVVLKTDSGQHVGHMLGESSGTIGNLHVLPEFRKKGHSKILVSQLARQYLELGEDVYVFVEETNAVSFGLHQSLGFRVVPDVQIMWIRSNPVRG